MIGEILWQPPADLRQSRQIGRFMEFAEGRCDRRFAGYDDLWRWSVEDLEGFWGSIWEFFELRSHAPFEQVLASREMPGAAWFEGARVNYAEHLVGRDEDTDTVAVVAHSQTRPELEVPFGELREQVARARAGLQRLGVGPGDRVVAYLPNIPETLVAFIATASLGAIWAACPPELGARSVIDRFAQIEPKVLIAVGGYGYRDRYVDRRDQVAEIRAALPSLQHVVWIPYGDARVEDATPWEE